MATTFEKGAKKREFLLSCQAGDWDLRLLREHRETLALDSGLPARLVSLPFIDCLIPQSAGYVYNGPSQ